MASCIAGEKQMIIGALDIGGTKTAVSVASYSGDGDFLQCLDILGKRTFSTGARSFDIVAAECASVLEDILCCSGNLPSSLSAVGVSAPGMVNEQSRLIFSPVTGWRDIDIRGAFGDIWSNRTGYSLPVEAACDVNACALAEVLCSGKDDMLWVTVSTGIGGAYVAGGKVYTGFHSVAGEIGHTKVEYNNPNKCACGQYGCAEAHASGTAVGKTVEKIASLKKEWADIFRRRGLALTAEGCSVLAHGGDGTAAEIFSAAGDYLGRALANAVNLLDPSVIYIGGGMSRSLDLMLPSIRRRIESGALFIHRGIPVLQTALGYDASLIGAYALAVKLMKDRSI